MPPLGPRLLRCAVAASLLAAPASKRLEAGPETPSWSSLTGDVAAHVVGFAGLGYHVASFVDGAPRLTIWDRAGPRHVLEEHVGGVEFLAAGGRLVSWGGDGAVKVWDASTGKLLQALQHDGYVICARELWGSGRVATASARGRAYVWDLVSGAAVWELPSPGIRGLEVFASGDRFVTWAMHPNAQLWDLRGDTPAALELRGHRGVVEAAAVFPSGDLVVTGGRDWKAMIWEAGTGEFRRQFMHGQWVTKVAAAADGRRVVTMTASGSIALFSVEIGRRLRGFGRPAVQGGLFATGFAMFPDGARLLSFGRKGWAVWNTSSGGLLREEPRTFSAMAVAPGGDIVAGCSGGGGVTVLNATTGAALSGAPAHAEPIRMAMCHLAIGRSGTFDARNFGHVAIAAFA